MQEVYKRINTPFWYITIAVFLALPFHVLIQDGMFMDAVHYTCVSKNLAQGFGTFWFPHFSNLDLDLEGVSAFHEQPPLVFGIQALFFKLLGNSMYVERIYVALTIVLVAYLIVKIWQCVLQKKQKKLLATSWLPVFVWITIPIVFWAASNNVHENTLNIFAMLSVWLSYQALTTETKNIWLWIVSGCCIFLATFSKGFPGFFPLVVPLIYALVYSNYGWKKMIVHSLILLCIPLMIYAILFLFPQSKESLSIYLFKRVFYRIESGITSHHRLETLVYLFRDLAPTIAIFLLVSLIGRFRKISLSYFLYGREALFFISIGLSASLPLMATMIQKSFYLIPAYPYFAIGLSFLMLPIIDYWLQLIKTGRAFAFFKGISLSLLIFSFIFVGLHYGKVSRDREILSDVAIIGVLSGEQTEITVPPELFFSDWILQCYMMRYHGISLNYKPEKPNPYFLKTKDTHTEYDYSTYERVDISTSKYEIYRLK